MTSESENRIDTRSNSERKAVGWGTVEFSTGIRVNPVRVYRNTDGSYDTSFKLIDIKITSKES